MLSKITLVVLNYARAYNLQEIILPIFEKYALIDEIIISHGRKDTAFNYESEHCRIVHRHDWGEVEQRYGVARRYLASMDARNDVIMQMDDDLVFSEEILNEISKRFAGDPEIIHGLVGRDMSPGFSYTDDPCCGEVAIVLPSGALHSKSLIANICEHFEVGEKFFSSKPTSIIWNGEDIFSSLVAVKLNRRFNKAHFLPWVQLLPRGSDQNPAISLKDDHIADRTEFVRYLVKTFQLDGGMTITNNVTSLQKIKRRLYQSNKHRIRTIKFYKCVRAIADTMTAPARNTFYAYKGRSIGCFILFAGHHRTGSTLIGGLLNAHPEMVVCHELRLLNHVSSKSSKGSIVRLICNRDKEVCDNTSYKSMGGNHSYVVKNQWQGKYSRLRAIGDKMALLSIRKLYDYPDLLDSLRGQMRVPARVLFTCRNPYDMIAAQCLRELPGKKTDRELSEFALSDAEKPKLDQKIISEFLEISNKLTKVLSLFSPDEIFLIKHEDFIASPKDKLREICAFLGVKCTEDYLTDCAAIVYSSPHQTRFKVQWTPGQIEEVAAAVKKHPQFEGYTFDA